jgi:UDP-3-O-[3-hydroxymyristoyl] glucosamine N-acyltransferase
VGPGARLGARVVLGQNSSVDRKAMVGGDLEIGALRRVDREGG